LFRVLFFLPYVIPFVAGVFIWQGMLEGNSGWINAFLRLLGVEDPPAWLDDPGWIYPGLVIMGVWGIGAGVIIYIAGLKGIPSELYDAARIDGAGAWAVLRHITVPMMSPVIFYTLVLAIVEVLQYFLVPLVLKNGTGEPGSSTLFFNLYLYKNFFSFQNMSYGATLAWLLFGITLVITLVLFRTSRRWVYYAGEAR
jgi:multiple sugar transport system permease protein